jgi:hypothetical protein
MLNTAEVFGSSIILAMAIVLSGFGPANADRRHYQAWISGGKTGTLSGYAELDWSDDGNVSGHICVYEAARFAAWTGTDWPDSSRNLDLGVVRVHGQIRGASPHPPKPPSFEWPSTLKAKADLHLALPEGPIRERLDGVIKEGPIEFDYGEVSHGYLNPPLWTRRGWQTPEPPAPPSDDQAETNESGSKTRTSSPFGVRLTEIDGIAENQSVEVRRKRRGKREIKLARLAKMNPNQAFAFLARNVPTEPIVPGFVWLIYEPEKRDAINRFLAQFPGAQLPEAPQPSCGAPVIQDGINVQHLLEHYIAARLVSSGLVRYAGPDFSPLSPPVEALGIKGTRVAAILEHAGFSIEQKSDQLATYFSSQLAAFVRYKRPRFPERWEISRRNSGAPMIYRAEVIGAVVSQCQSTGWESFTVQIMPSSWALSDGSPGVVVNVIEGFESPGPINQRPSDARFKENPLNDDRLSRIQEAFVDFLRRRGFNSADRTSDEGELSPPCRL